LLNCIKRRRILAPAQLVSALAQEVLGCLRNLFERLAQTRNDRLGQELGCRPPDHDNVVAQAKDAAD
jgi:hypothetical protein